MKLIIDYMMNTLYLALSNTILQLFIALWKRSAWK